MNHNRDEQPYWHEPWQSLPILKLVGAVTKVAELQRRLQQPTATDQSGGAGGAALRADVRQLHSHVARLQDGADASAAVTADVTRLWQQVPSDFALQSAALQQGACAA